MSSVDPAVAPDERVVVRTGLHPMAFSGAWGMALFVALVVVLLIRHNELPLATDVRIALVGALVAALGALPSWLRWRNTGVVVTDRRILATAGARGQYRVELPLAEATVTQEAGLTGRLLDHATLSIAAPDGRRWSIGHVARASTVADAVRNASAKRRPAAAVGDESRRGRRD